MISKEKVNESNEITKPEEKKIGKIKYFYNIEMLAINCLTILVACVYVIVLSYSGFKDFPPILGALFCGLSILLMKLQAQDSRKTIDVLIYIFTSLGFILTICTPIIVVLSRG